MHMYTHVNHSISVISVTETTINEECLFKQYNFRYSEQQNYQYDMCTLQKYLHMLYSIGDVSVVCAVYVYAYMYV